MKFFLLDCVVTLERKLKLITFSGGEIKSIFISKVPSTFYIFLKGDRLIDDVSEVVFMYTSRLGILQYEYEEVTKNYVNIPHQTFEMDKKAILVKHYRGDITSLISSTVIPAIIESVVVEHSSPIETFLFSSRVGGWFDIDEEDLIQIDTNKYNLECYENVFAATDIEGGEESIPILPTNFRKVVLCFGETITLATDSSQPNEVLTYSELHPRLLALKPHILILYNPPSSFRSQFVHFNVAPFVRQLCRPGFKEYSLATVSKGRLAVGLLQLIEEFQIVEIAQSIRNLTYLPFSKLEKSSERVEWLITQRVIQSNTVVQKSNGRFARKESYQGGLVMTPRVGIYTEPVFELDFYSHYPSIIKVYKLCWTSNGSILPVVMEDVLTQRKNCTFLPKKMALKLLANTTYGVLGFAYSPYYSPFLASEVTRLGREVLSETRNLIEQQFHLPVIYGDTDSLFVKGDPTLIPEILAFVHSRLKPGLLLESDKIFKRLILFSKKSLFGIDVNDVEVNKVSSLKRRDYSPFNISIGVRIVRTILSDSFTYDQVWEIIEETITRYKTKSVDIEQLVISEKLDKRLDQYTTLLPHVKAALLLPPLPQKKDAISYVVCQDQTNPYIPISLYSSEKNKIDVKHYLMELCSILEYILSLRTDFNLKLLKEKIFPPYSSSSSSSSNHSILDFFRPFPQVFCLGCNKSIQIQGYRPLVDLINFTESAHVHLGQKEITQALCRGNSCPECSRPIESGLFVEPRSSQDFDWRYTLFQFRHCKECENLVLQEITKDQRMFDLFDSMVPTL